MKELTGSGYYVQRNCYASSRMEEQAEQEGKIPTSNEYAERGREGHAALATGQVDHLPKDLSDSVNIIKERSSKQLASFIASREGVVPEAIRYFKEERFYFRDGIKPIYSGQPDLVVVGDNWIYFQDFKFGKITSEWSDLWLNQLDAYAAILHSETDITDVTGELIPLIGDSVRTATYTELILAKLIQSIGTIVIHQQADHPPTPGDWCRHCNGRLVCPVALTCDKALEPHYPQSQLPSGVDGAALVSRIKTYISVAKDVLAWYEQQLEKDPEFLGGIWKLKPGWEKATITDNIKAMEALSRLLSVEEQSACITVNPGKVREILVKKFPHLSNNPRRLLDDVLGGVVKYTRTKATLEKNDHSS